MTDDSEAFATNDSYKRDGEAYSLTTTPFDGRVTVEDSQYRVTIEMPTLDGATEDAVDDVVEDGWFETLALRVADAPGATRADIEVPEPTVERTGETVAIEFEFTHDDPTRAAEAAKVLIEYAEGTYVEGIVPGYTYQPPVADLLSRARQHGDGEGDGESGAMPL
jgi:hypothetical protein